MTEAHALNQLKELREAILDARLKAQEVDTIADHRIDTAITAIVYGLHDMAEDITQYQKTLVK